MWNWLLSLYLLFLPFQFALNPAEDVDLAIGRVIAVFIIVMWIADSLARRTITLPLSAAFWFGATFLCISGLSLFWANNGEWAMRKCIFLLSLLPIFFVSSSLARQNRISAQTIFSFATFSGTLSAVIALAQFFGQFLFGLNTVLIVWREHVAPFFLGVSFSEAVNTFPSWLVNISGETVMRAIAFFPDPHIAAFFWELTLPIAIALFFKTKQRRFLFASLILFSALLFTFSRGAYVALFAGTTVLIFSFFLRHPIFLVSKKGILALLVITGTLFISAETFAKPLLNRFISSFDQREGSNEERFAMWQEGVQIFLEHPLSGVGLGNFALEVKPSADYREPIYAHNTYLDIAAETGLFGAICWTVWLFVSALRFRKLSKIDPLFLAGSFSILLFGVHAIFDTPLYSVHILPLLCILLGLAFSKKTHEKLKDMRNVSKKHKNP